MKNLFTKQLLSIAFFSLLQIFGFLQVNAQTETIPTGSFIINMGNTNTASINDDVKPYGMIYDLMRNYNVPVKWVIEPGKAKDGADFIHNGITYKGGTFIIPAGFRNATVNARISFWQTQGVVGASSVSNFTAPVYKTLTSVPRWTFDAANGSIAQGYLTAAGITLTAFPNAYNFKAVGALDCCDDFFVMPHADPTWATHNRLYSWNKNCLGSIWAACHAVSALENSINPANPVEQMNFLSTRTSATTPTPWPNNSLKLWGQHSGGTPAYTHTLFNDPVAQYMGVTDLSQLNGSEQIYIPKQSTDVNGATRWRPGANIIAYDPTQVNVPSPDYANGNVAAVVVYGRGLDDPTRGFVMYEAGHSHLKGTASDGPALRAFLNFSFFQVQPKAPQLSFTGISAGQTINGSETITGLNVVATSPLTGITFTYQWSSNCGGSFSNPTSATTNFTAPATASTIDCILSCIVTDNCGRKSFQSFPVKILGAAPPTVTPDVQSIDPGCGPVSVTKNVLTNDVEPDGQPMTLTSINGNSSGSLTTANGGLVTFMPNGDVSYTSAEGFIGVEVLNYTVCDNTSPTPLCSNSTYTISIGNVANVPNAVNDAASIAEDVILTNFNVLANDLPVVSGPLNVSGISTPANGKVSINPDNTITYVPNPDFAGSEVLTYKIVNSLGYTRTATLTITVNNNACDAGTFEASPATSGTATYRMTNTPVPPTTFGDAMIRQIVLALNNWGATTTLEVAADNGDQPKRSLLQFSLAGIPGGATITSSQLRLVRTGGNNTAQNIGAYRVTTSWNEGTGNNNANTAIINGSTWLTTSFTTNWQSAGGDFNTTNGAVTSVSNSTGGIGGTAIYGWDVTAITQGWYASTFTNNGLILKDVLENNGNDKVFGSLNNGTLGNRPVLRVTYEVTPGVPVVLDIQASKDTWIQHEENYENVFGTSNANNQFQVNARGENNEADRLLFKFDLSAPSSGTAPPSTSTITSSTLTLNRTGGDNTAVSIGVYQATNSWNEANDANQQNSLLLNGATWHTRNFTQTWNTAGGDFNLTPTSSQSVLATGAYNWDVLGIVQNWFNAVPAPNHGFLVKAVTEVGNVQHEFASRENGTAALRPTLVINYNNPAVCGTIPARAPLGMQDTATTNSSTMLSIPVASNDELFGQAITSVIITTAPSSGSAIVVGNSIQFTPAVVGVATLQYTVTTANGSDVVRVYIVVTGTPVNAIDDTPVAALSGVVQTINVKANDIDPEGTATSTVTIATAPKYGTAIVDGSGQIVYTANAGFTGNDTLTYSICEPAVACSVPACDTAKVFLTVQNRAPIANNDTKDITPCIANTINLTGNDTDPEGNSLSINIVSVVPADASTLVANPDGTITFTPQASAAATYTVTYNVTDNGVTPQTSANATVTINVPNPVNTAPVALDDYADTTNMDAVLYYNVLDNDSDPQGHQLANPTVTVQPLHGTAIVLASGAIQYTPNPGYAGADTLTYQVCDISTNPGTCSNVLPLCSTAKLFIFIVAPNSVVANNDENSTWINTPVSGGVLSNDFDPEGDIKVFTGFVSGGSPVTSGSITVSGVDATGAPVANAGTLLINPDGSYTFTPANNFIGVVTVPYTIADNQSNAAIDTAFLKITVNPLPAVTNSVIANNDENTTLMNTAVSSTLFGNDSDPQGNTFTATAFMVDTNSDGVPDAAGTVGTAIQVSGVTPTVVPVANAGSVIVNAGGTYTYTPAPDFTGRINASYTITDALGATATAAITISILPDLNAALNNAPVAGDDFAYTNVNTPVNASFVSNDNDPNANPVSFNGTTIVPGGPKTPIGTAVATAQGGNIRFFTDGTYTYTPPDGYVGPDSVGYEICDVTAINPQPLCARAFIHILVGVNNSTDAVNDENSTWQDVNVSGVVVANDFDTENHTQTFGSFLAQGTTPGAPITTGATVSGVDKTGAPVANAGTLTFSADGSYTFDPTATFTGTVTVPYRVCDNGNASKCDTAFLTITVDPLPTTGINTVIANNDENVSYGSAVSGDVDANDKDPQGNAFTVTAVTGGAPGTPFTVAGVDQNGNPVANAGTLVINANGTYTYTPAAGFVGSISVPYSITDALGAISTAVLSIDVLRDPNGPANDPPFAGDDFGYTTVNTPVGGSFIANDNDPNTNPVSLNGTTIVPGGAQSPVGAPVPTAQGGTVQFYADGTYLYTPAAGYVGPDRVSYEICDVTAIAPQPLCNTATIHLLVGPGINISGKVWDDVNGNVTDDGAGEPETNVGGTLYVNIINSAGNVVATVPVAADGTYSFTNVTPGADYVIQLSTNQGTVGSPAPAVALPAGWINTGENRNGVIDGGTLGVIDTRNYGFTSTVNFDFGIERLPESAVSSQGVGANPGAFNTTTVNPGYFVTSNVGANPNTQDYGGGTVANIRITAFPSNANTITIDGVVYINGGTCPPATTCITWPVAGVTTSFTDGVGPTNPILIDPIDGTVSVTIPFAAIDNAGEEDPTQGSVTIIYDIVLPIQLISFTANPQGDNVQLSWVVATEINVANYEIEFSANGINYSTIGSNNATGSRNYNFTHTAPRQGLNYYRIKIVDKDGRVSYTEIRKVNFGLNAATVKIYPNPAASVVNITVTNAMVNKPATIQMLTIDGKLVYQQNAIALSQTESINVSKFANGEYVLRIITGKEVINRQFQIVK